MMKHKRLYRFFAFLAVILCLLSFVVPIYATDFYTSDAENLVSVEAFPFSLHANYQRDDDYYFSTFNLTSDFFVKRVEIDSSDDDQPVFDFSRVQTGRIDWDSTFYQSGTQISRVSGANQFFVNMFEDRVESDEGYTFDELSFSNIHAPFIVDVSHDDWQELYISGSDFYIYDVGRDDALFYFEYLYDDVRYKYEPQFIREQVTVEYSINFYVPGSLYSDTFTWTDTVYTRFVDSTDFNTELIFAIELSQLGYKYDQETGQFLNKINGDPYVGFYIDSFTIRVLDGIDVHDFFDKKVRINSCYAFQTVDADSMRLQDLVAKRTIADDINFHVDFITDAVGGFLDLQIFPGFSLGGLLLVIIAFSMVMWFLRVFGGG